MVRQTRAPDLPYGIGRAFFCEVVELYTQASGPDATDRSELIGDLLDYEWGVFSEELVDMRQELAVAILR